MSKAHIITGVMGSGKSEQLLAIAERNKGCLIISCAGVTVTSRNGKWKEAYSPEVLLDKPCKFDNDTKVILIDEVQWLTEDLVNRLEVFRLNGWEIYCFGLESDWRYKRFKTIDLLIKMYGVPYRIPCTCTHESCNMLASFHNYFSKNGSDVVTDKEEMFKAVCLEHWHHRKDWYDKNF